MIPLHTVRELFDYNYWARDRQLQACETLTEEQFQTSMGSSFSSVRDTLLHLLMAEWVWLERWQHDRSVSKDDVKEFSAEALPTLDDIRRRWMGVENDMRRYLSTLTEETMSEPLTYVNFKGETWTYPRWHTLFHLINHQSYHRGQMTTLLRQLGVAAPQVDFLVAKDSGLNQ
jgi:uncharacterized damage-inducible protein DinB